MADRIFIVNVGIGTPPLGYQWQGVPVGDNPNIEGDWDDLGTAISQVVDDTVYDWLRVNVTNAYGSKLSAHLELNPVVQTVLVQFTVPSANVGGDVPSGVNVGVEIITSDGNPLVAPVTIEIHDLLTGSAVPGLDYTMTTPQVLAWAGGEPNGDIKNALISVAGVNSATCVVNANMQNPVGAAIGAPSTYDLTIINIGA